MAGMLKGALKQGADFVKGVQDGMKPGGSTQHTQPHPPQQQGYHGQAAQGYPGQHPQAAQGYPGQHPQAAQGYPGQHPQAAQGYPGQYPQAAQAYPGQRPQQQHPPIAYPPQHGASPQHPQQPHGAAPQQAYGGAPVPQPYGQPPQQHAAGGLPVPLMYGATAQPLQANPSVSASAPPMPTANAGQAGSWDCPKCTYVNPGAAQRCEICGGEPVVRAQTAYPQQHMVQPAPDLELLRARAVNDALLRLVDDVLADATAPQGGAFDPLKVPKGLGEVRTGFDPTDPRTERLPLYKLRRGHMYRTRFAVTDVVDTVQEQVMDALHSNVVMNKLEGAVKTSGLRAMAKLGSTADSVRGLLSGKSAAKPVGSTEETISTMEVVEVNLDWSRKYPPAHFGARMREVHFSHIAPGYLDGAGAGCVPSAVLEAHSRWDKANQVNPVMWRFKTLPVRLRNAEHFLADELGVDPNDMKLVLGIEQALCSVLMSLPWMPGDGIVMITDESFHAQQSVQAACRKFGVRVEIIATRLPTTDEEIRARVRDWASALPPHHTFKLAILPEVTYKSGIKIKTTKVTNILHQHKIAVFVDGTMAVGQRELAIGMKHCDWYAASLCSWMYCEPGTGFLVTHPHKQICTNTLTVSYFDRGPAGAPDFRASNEKEFSYTGLQDFASWCSIYHALRFVSHCCTGGAATSGSWSKVRGYTHPLAKQVAARVGEMWGTRSVQTDGDFAATVVMPLPGGQGFDDRTAAILTTYFANGTGVLRIVCLRLTPAGGGPEVSTLCARFSCQIFNELGDFEAAARAVLHLQQTPGYGAVQVPDVETAVAMYNTLL